MAKAKVRLRLQAAMLVCAVLSSAYGQSRQREPLTEAEQGKIAAAGIDADLRIGLYTKFLDEHANRLEAVGKRSESGRGRRLESELEDFSALVDELASNLDEYGGRKADLRKALKGLNQALPHWQETLRGLPRDPVSDVALDDATDALGDLASQAKSLAAAQKSYFKKHKGAAGQQWEEPK